MKTSINKLLADHEKRQLITREMKQSINRFLKETIHPKKNNGLKLKPLNPIYVRPLSHKAMLSTKVVSKLREEKIVDVQVIVDKILQQKRLK